MLFRSLPAGIPVHVPHLLLGERQDGENTMHRLICEAPPPDAHAVTPTLEDAFLYVYQGEEGGNAAVSF